MLSVQNAAVNPGPGVYVRHVLQPRAQHVRTLVVAVQGIWKRPAIVGTRNVNV